MKGIPIVDNLKQYLCLIDNYVVQRGSFKIGDRSKSQGRLQTVQDISIFGFEDLLFLRTPLRESKESISCCISLTLAIFDLDMVSRKLLSIPNLSRAQALCIYKFSKIVMVH